MSFMALLVLLKDGTLGLQGISGVKVLYVYIGMGFRLYSTARESRYYMYI